MLLNSLGINQFVDKLKDKNTYVDQLLIKYNPRKEKPFVRLWCHGMEDIHQEGIYYENISENIEAATTSWLEPICRSIKAPFQATIDIDEEGNFETNKIEVSIDLYTPTDKEATMAFLYNRVKPIVLLNDFIQSVEIIGFQGYLQKITFNLIIDGTKITNLFNHKKLNRSIQEQWLASINNSLKVNKNEEQFENMFYVVNGKINVEYKSELVHQYFALNNA